MKQRRGWMLSEVVLRGSCPAPIPQPPTLFLTLLTKDNPNEIKKCD